MSKKTMRNSFFLKAVATALCAGGLIAGCATKGDGDGSETHFLCRSDSDCAARGADYRCVAEKCTNSTNLDAGPETGSTGGSANGGNAGSAGASGTGTTNGGSGNAANAGAGGNETPTCPQQPFYFPPDAGPGPPQVSPPGFVDGGVYGCYPPRPLAPGGWMPNAPAPQCPGTSGQCTYAPTALPCGACSANDFCGMSVAAICDCGVGPFVDVYWDVWGCKCQSGQWDCRVVGASGASCTSCNDACVNETRSTPYSPGMVVTGQSGVTVALTSNPAPPALGDNTWTFMLKDPAGALLPGATITVTQNMVDHGHAGAKAVVVTDLGGGQYRAAPVNFNMSGYWETTLLVKKAPIDDEVVIKLCVQ